MMRNCVCGKPIPHNRQLCASCILEPEYEGDPIHYGSDQTKWPEWLTDWMSSYQKELNAERDYHHLSIDVNEGIVEAKPQFKLNGCRTETHLYEDRHKYGG